MNWYKQSQETEKPILPNQEVSSIAPQNKPDPIETPEFKAWFGEYPPRSSSKEPMRPGGSIAVDKNGKPRVFYHGTNADFTSFETGLEGTNSNAFGSWKTKRHALFFTESPEIAFGFASQHGEKGSRTVPVYLNIRQPLDLRWGVPDDVIDQLTQLGMNHRWLMQFGPTDTWELFDDEDGKMFIDAIQKLGYDGAFINEPGNHGTMDSTTWVVFSPSQVKSAIGNTGKFDPKDKNILAGSNWYKKSNSDPMDINFINDLFDREVADAQRGAPEMAMLAVQRTMGGGVLNFVVEHVGDLTHRMAEKVTANTGGYQYVEEKVRRALRFLNQGYGFDREFRENVQNNARAKNIPEQQLMAQVDAALQAYAAAHQQIPVYNEVQRLARDAAISLGYKQWNRASTFLMQLQNYLNEGVEAWAERSREYQGQRPQEKVAKNGYEKTAMPMQQQPPEGCVVLLRKLPNKLNDNPMSFEEFKKPFDIALDKGISDYYAEYVKDHNFQTQIKNREFPLFETESYIVSYAPKSVNNKCEGKIEFSRLNENLWFVYHAMVPRGYGPLLYEKAMEFVTKRGGRLISHEAANEICRSKGFNGASGSTSERARKVWEEYAKRSQYPENNIKGHPLPLNNYLGFQKEPPIEQPNWYKEKIKQPQMPPQKMAQYESDFSYLEVGHDTGQQVILWGHDGKQLYQKEVVVDQGPDMGISSTDHTAIFTAQENRSFLGWGRVEKATRRGSISFRPSLENGTFTGVLRNNTKIMQGIYLDAVKTFPGVNFTWYAVHGSKPANSLLKAAAGPEDFGFGQKEELDPELKRYLTVGPHFTALQHPLVYSVPYFPELNAMLNKQLRAKKEIIAKEEAAGDYRHAMWLHERPHRLNYFARIADRLSDEDYWKTLGTAYVDSENIWQNAPLVKYLLSNPNRQQSRQMIMDEDDLAKYNTLPETFKVYRGCISKNKNGMSWTLDPGKAEWFARRLSKKNPIVITGIVNKADVIAYFGGREEQEIVVDPRKVKNKQERQL